MVTSDRWEEDAGSLFVFLEHFFPLHLTVSPYMPGVTSARVKCLEWSNSFVVLGGPSSIGERTPKIQMIAGTVGRSLLWLQVWLWFLVLSFVYRSFLLF